MSTYRPYKKACTQCGRMGWLVTTGNGHIALDCDHCGVLLLSPARTARVRKEWPDCSSVVKPASRVAITVPALRSIAGARGKAHACERPWWKPQARPALPPRSERETGRVECGYCGNVFTGEVVRIAGRRWLVLPCPRCACHEHIRRFTPTKDAADALA